MDLEIQVPCVSDIGVVIYGIFFICIFFHLIFWVRDQGIREALFSGTLSLMDNALF